MVSDVISPTHRELFKDKITEWVKGGVSFGRSTAELLRGPCVYLFLKENEPLYIGMSEYGLSRVFSTHHNKYFSEVLSEYDEVLIYQVKDAKAARDTEALMISSLRPRANIRGGVSRVIETFPATSQTLRNQGDSRLRPGWRTALAKEEEQGHDHSSSS